MLYIHPWGLDDWKPDVAAPRLQLIRTLSAALRPRLAQELRRALGPPAPDGEAPSAVLTRAAQLVGTSNEVADGARAVRPRLDADIPRTSAPHPCGTIQRPLVQFLNGFRSRPKRDPCLCDGVCGATRTGASVGDECAHLSTFIVTPMTTGGHPYPFRIACRFQKKDGYIVLDQVHTVDRRRFLERLGRVPQATLGKALDVLQEMFAE